MRASPRTSATRPIRKTETSTPRCSSVRATTKPSPPLLPRPHSTATCRSSRSPCIASIAATTWRPAFSISTSDGMPMSSIVRRSASRICAAFRTRIVIARILSCTLPHGSDGQRQRPRVRPGARGHFGLRSRVPVRRRRLRDAAHLQRPAVPVRSPHAPAAQVGRDAGAADSADRRSDRRALPRDDARGRARRQRRARGLHPHPGHPRRRRADLRSRRHPGAVDRRHRQAERRSAARGVRARRQGGAGQRDAQPSGHGQPADQVEQPAEQRAGDAGSAAARRLRRRDAELPRASSPNARSRTCSSSRTARR